MAITNAQQYQQLVNKPANGKRPGYRGIGGYQEGKSKSTSTKSSSTKSPGHPSNRTLSPSTNKATSGGGGGGNNKPPKTKTSKPKTKTVKYSNLKTGPYLGAKIKNKYSYNPIKNWKDHAILSNLMKKNKIPGGNIPNYHNIAAYDFDKRFGLPDVASKALAYGYQGITETAKALTKPTSTNVFGLSKNLFDAGKTTVTEGNLNAAGIDGLNTIDQENYERALDYSNITNQDDMRAFTAQYLAEGGIISLRKRK